MMAGKRLRLTINGIDHEIEAESSTPLLTVLRNELHLTAAKFGCGYGECGACTVIIDGFSARSCVIPISLAAGHRIVTLEGLADGDRPHPVQQCFVEEQAAQCGYCLNGMIMTAKALLDRNPSPSEDEIRNELRFNLCRCGAHIEIIEAVKRARHSPGNPREHAMMEEVGFESRQALLRRSGVLLVTTARPSISESSHGDSNILISITDEGRINAFCGKVDLGTGIRTALAQIVAEELDVAIEDVDLSLGDTENGPNDGPTIASETIQVTAIPLRIAAAQARLHLITLAAGALDSDLDDLRTDGGRVYCDSDPSRAITFGDLVSNRRIHLALDTDTPVKSVSEYRIVGRSVGRTDIPDKALGRLVYVHDVRIPGMLHGRVVRPPYSGLDSGRIHRPLPRERRSAVDRAHSRYRIDRYRGRFRWYRRRT